MNIEDIKRLKYEVEFYKQQIKEHENEIKKLDKNFIHDIQLHIRQIDYYKTNIKDCIFLINVIEKQLKLND